MVASLALRMGTEGRRVLLVDDDDSIRQVVSIFLADEGYEVRSAGDGKAALEIIGSHFKPDLILVDLRMPVMDGAEFVRTYRARPGPHAPVIAFVAALHAQEAQNEIGAAVLLEKPFDLDDLLTALDQAKTYTGVPTSAQSQANLASL